MDEAKGFLEELEKLEDPKTRLERLKEYPNQEDPEIREALLWWEARHRFLDKKRTRVEDRFVWLLLCLGTQAGGQDKRAVRKAYESALLSQETRRAQELTGGLYRQLLAVSRFYISTVRTKYSIFGFSVGGEPKQEEVFRRITETVAGSMIPSVYTLCGDKPYADLLIRALFEGAKAAYPGIQPQLLSFMEEHYTPQCLEFVRPCVRPEGLE